MDELTRLALAAQSGDEIALERLIRLLQPDVWRFCAYLSGHGEADDLAQEVLVKAVRSLHRYRGESPVRAWVMRIARFTCADQVRRNQRRRRLQQRLEADAGTDSDATVTSDEQALLELLGQIDPDRRQAFVLTQISGLSYEEAADVCGCPLGTIRSRVARARTDLQAILRSIDDEERT
jgi:RNA polymerase sigma-70 factor (ECF subfamily)